MTEARAASQLNHPNSVAVFDFGRTDDGQPYLVMEFLRGKDLARVAYEDGPLPFSASWTCCDRCSPRWVKRTISASCTATSSPRT